MATADANGLPIFNQNDQIAPIQSVLNSIGSATSALWDKATHIHKVTNTSARTALVGTVGISNISTTNPLIVWRRDAQPGRQLEYTTNGTAWHAYMSSEVNVAWTALTGYVSGYTGDVEIARVGNSVEIRGGVTGSFPDGGQTNLMSAGSIPPALRPEGTRSRFGSVYLPGGYPSTAFARPDGSIACINRSGASRSGAQFSISYLLI